jgi:adenosylcobinamide kinase/adenosylcobinamide-phosphate guanylyltransferase
MANNEPTLTLLLGGARSGKSTYAEALASRLGQRVLYVATAEALDDEMQARVLTHRARRPSGWATLEAPRDVGAMLASSPDAASADVILLDCLTLLVSNIILSATSHEETQGKPETLISEAESARAHVQAEVEAILKAHDALGSHLIIVSNEVGLGLVPPYRLGRIYRDCLGWANQTLAGIADRAILMVAGLPVDLKTLPLAWLD